MKKGSLLLVLHAHLPFVRHPEHDDFLEERWLFEAITETYLPLIEIYDRFLAEGVPFRITMSITPTLSTMLLDPLLKERYARHLDKMIELADKEIDRTAGNEAFQKLALMYRERFEALRHIYRAYEGDLIRAFRKFQDSGQLEIITCGSTHGFMPFMLPVRQSVVAQVRTACEHYEKTFGRRPRGIWLPECGYYEGYDEILKENGLDYFFLDHHGVLHAEPRPKYGVFAPIQTPNGVYAFGRDVDSSKQVWSASEGYPGDFNYREFYRDIGFDLPEEYIKPYIHKDGIRINTGMKYFKITGRTNDKQPYDPDRAREKAAEHAGNFMFYREKQVEHIYENLDKTPVIVAPYDAELFGHWWYEGPQFLEFLIRKVVFDSKSLTLTHAPEYLEQNRRFQPARPTFSSWGYKGYGEFWLDQSNHWVYPHLHAASERMHQLAKTFKQPSALERRALNQAARELMLAESSDWAFIMKTGSVVPYAVKRTKDHLTRFLKLNEELSHHRIDEKWLSEIEGRDNIFPEINYQIYA